MENIKNETVATSTVKKNEVKTIEFKSRFALTPKEINELPRIVVKVTKTIIKSTGSTMFRVNHTLKCNSTETSGRGESRNQEIIIDYKGKDFNAIKFELFKENNGLKNVTEHVVKVPFRAVKGDTADGHTYFLYELFLGGNMILSDFYTNDEIELLKKRGGILGYKFEKNTNIKTLEELSIELNQEANLQDIDI